jgi:DNA uptake protein ComE-like DNA-binding protein
MDRSDPNASGSKRALTGEEAPPQKAPRPDLAPETGRDAAPAADAEFQGVSFVQDHYGNTLVADALNGEEVLGLGPVIAADLTLDVGGLQSDHTGTLSSNAMTLAAWRRTTVDPGIGLDDRALAQLRPGGGRPLPEQQLARMETAFDHDFDHVRVHVDADAAHAAQALDAHAFALGSDIFFGDGEWAPETARGDRLLAHELTHVVQHDDGRISSGGGVSSPDDALEREAYGNEDRILGLLDQIEEEDAEAFADEITALAEGEEGEASQEEEEDETPEIEEEEAVAEPTVDAEPEVDPGEPADGVPPDADVPDDTAMRDTRGQGGGGMVAAQEWVRRSHGTPLPTPIAQRLAAVLGHDLSGVRIHVDSTAAEAAESLNARAFALGADVFFGAGMYQPNTAGGVERLAHELTHVVQHEEGRLPQSDALEVSDPASTAEQEAEATASEAVDALAGDTAPVPGTDLGAMPSSGTVEAPSQGVAHRDYEPALTDPDDKAQNDEDKKKLDRTKGTNATPDPDDDDGNPPNVPGQDDQPKKPKKDKEPKDNQDGDDKGGPGDDKGGPGDDKGEPGKDEGAGDDTGGVGPLAVNAGGGGDDTPAPDPVIPEIPGVTKPAIIKLPDPPKFTEDEIKRWKADTGMEPAEHQAKIRAGFNKLSTDIAAMQKGLVDLAETKKADIDTAQTTHKGTLDAAVTTGKGAVTTAFTGAATKARTAAGTAITSLDTHEANGLTLIADVEKKENDNLTNAYNSADTGAKALIELNASSYKTLIKEEADKLKPVAREARKTTKEHGEKLAKNYKPETKSGWDSLREDLKQSAAKDLAADVAKGVEKKIKAEGRKLDKRAKATGEAAVKHYGKDAQEDLDKKKKAAEENFKKANTASKKKLTDGKTEATTKIEGIRDNVDERMKTADTKAQGEVDKAATTLRDNTDRSATELKGGLEKKAKEDASYYATLVDDLQKRVNKAGGALNWGDVEQEIKKIRDKLKENNDAHIEALETLKNEGVTAYGTTVTKQIGIFNTAIETQKGEAVKWGNGVEGEMNQAATAFGNSLTGIATSHQTTLSSHVQPVQDSATLFVETAKGAFTKFAEFIKKRFEQTAKDLKQQVEENLKKIDDKKILETSQKNFSKKKKALDKDAVKLRKAMDGLGTDEGAIHKTLRKASYGQIEGLEEQYNHHYHKRDLRYDIDDEMSGNDYKIAMAYLDHDRATAIKLELEEAQGWLNDDEDRIEDVLRNCSEKEIKDLKKNNPDVIEDVKDCLGGADLATVNALLDTDISREEAKLKADAIRLHDAMDGWGTDEAKVEAILKRAKTPEERERLRAHFSQYSGKNLDSMLKDEFGGISGTGHDLTHVLTLAKVEREEEEVTASAVLKAGDGAGTDEKGMFNALKNAEHAGNLEKLDKGIEDLDEKLKAASDPKIRAVLQAQKDKLKAEKDEAIKERVTELDKHIKRLTKGKYETVAEYMASEMEGLELRIAKQYLRKGKCDPELLIEYAVRGAGTDEALIKEALSNAAGEPLSKGKVQGIEADYAGMWGKNLRSVLRGELGGRDWHDVDILLYGKPETPADLKYLANKKYEFENSGVLNGIGKLADDIGLTDTYTDMENQKDRFEAEFKKLTPAQLVTKLADLQGTGAQLEELYQYLSADIEAYGKMKAAVVDALVMALEIIGGVIATIATAGASSPLLAAIIANIIIGATGIAVKKLALGDAYGNDQMALDTIKMLGTSALGALGEVKAIGKLAENVGKKAVAGAGKVLGAMKTGASKVGFNVGADAFTMGPKAAKYLQMFVEQGTKSVITGAPGDAWNAAFDDKSWDKGIEDWLGNIATSTVKGVPSAFLAGGTTAVLGEGLGKSKTRREAMLKGAVTSMGANTAGMLGNVDSYKNAGEFWKKMWQSNFKAGLKGGISAAANRHVLAKQTAKDLAAGRMTAEQFAQVAPYLNEKELFAVARYAGAKRLPADIKQQMVDLAYKKYNEGDPEVRNDPSLVALAMNHANFKLPAADLENFTPKQKLMIAAKGDIKKLPKDFLDEDVHGAFEGMPSFQKVALAVQLGWDDLPESFRKSAVKAFSEKRTILGVELWHMLSKKDMLNAAGGQQGKLPDELVAVAQARISKLSHKEKIEFANKVGLDKIEGLPDAIKKEITDAVEARVKAGSKDPVTMAAAVRLGKVKIDDEALAGISWTNEGKLEFLALTGMNKEVFDKAKKFTAGALKAFKEIGPRRALAFAGAVGMHMIPKDFKPTLKDHFKSTNANNKLDAIGALGWDNLDATMKKDTFDDLPNADFDKRLSFVHAVGIQNCPRKIQEGLQSDLEKMKNKIKEDEGVGKVEAALKLAEKGAVGGHKEDARKKKLAADKQMLGELEAGLKGLTDPSHGLPVNLDSASKDDLIKAGFSKKEAGQIIANREANSGQIEPTTLPDKARTAIERIRKEGVKPKDTPKPTEADGPKPARTTLDILNDGTEEEIAKLPGMDVTKAKKVIAHRKKNGEFTDISGVKKIKGVGTKTARTLKGAEADRQHTALADDLKKGKIKAADLEAMEGLSDADKIAIAKKAKEGGFLDKLPKSFKKKLEEHENPDTPDPKDPKDPKDGGTPPPADPSKGKKAKGDPPTELEKVSKELGVDLDKRPTKKTLKKLGFTDKEAGQLLDHIQKMGGIDRSLIAATHPKAANALRRLASPEKDVLKKLNSGTFDDLVALPGIGEKLATRILAERKKGKVYNSLDELKDISKHKVVGDQAVFHLKREAHLKTNMDKDLYEAYLRDNPNKPMDAEAFAQRQRAKEKKFLAAVSSELQKDPKKLAAAKRIMGIETGSVDELTAAWKRFIADADFSSGHGKGGKISSAYSLDGFRGMLLTNKRVTTGLMITMNDKPTTAYDRDGKKAGIGRAGSGVFVASLEDTMDMTIHDYPRKLGIVKKNWRESRQKLADMVAEHGLKDGRKKWLEWAESPEGLKVTGGFKDEKYMHIIVNPEEIQKVRYTSQHLSSGVTEVTIPAQPASQLDPALINVELPDPNELVIDAVKRALKAKYPDIADDIDDMGPKEMKKLFQPKKDLSKAA